MKKESFNPFLVFRTQKLKKRGPITKIPLSIRLSVYMSDCHHVSHELMTHDI